MSRPPAIVRTRQQRWWIWLCVVTVVGFQALGLVHRALHGGPMPEPIRLAVAAAQQAAAIERAELAAAAALAASGDADEGPILTFGHVAGSGDCQLLDQLSHVLGPIVQASAWTAMPPDIPVGIDQPHDATLAQQWRKGARGPPRA
ncbi:hypothetical protein [Roseateles sp. L2-2]|uniref:hypothetical protein n=1 Tax=Roseateles TaxID=93681 RepID=UPI003D365B63